MINVSIPAKETDLSPRIMVIGVGGAGGNAVNNMIMSDLDGVEFLVCNSDAQALKESLADHQVQLGINIAQGLGAGANPEVGRATAEESIDEVMEHLEGMNMAFITCGMGGGTGTGAAPVIAKAAREKGILTVGVVTKPFHFEGAHRMKLAEEGIRQMQEYVDTLIVIPNQNLFRIANEKTTFSEAFKMADSVLQSGVRGVTDLMVKPGMINLDFADVKAAMMEMGKAMMGTGEASGEKRAIESAEAAINNPLLDDVSMKGARGVIINITGGYDMTLFEVDEACNRIRDEVDGDANIIFGSTFDDKLEGVMRVSVVATGIDIEESRKSKPFKPASINIVAAEAGVRKAPERVQPKASSVEASGMASASSAMPSMPVAPAREEKSASDVRTATSSRDIFEHAGISTKQSEEQNEGQNEDQMRGLRYGSSFIPPKAVEVSAVERSYAPQSQSTYQAMPQNTGQQAVAQQSYAEPQMSSPVFSSGSYQQAAQPAPEPQQEEMRSGYVINPAHVSPASAVQEPKRTPSLFERITGAHRPHPSETNGGESSGSLFAGLRPRRQEATQEQPAPTGLSAPKRDVDPEKQDLDIPAFLRRQAN